MIYAIFLIKGYWALWEMVFVRVLYESQYGSFRKLGGPYFGVLIIGILLFRVLY